MLKAVCIVLGVAVNALPADIELAPNGRGTNFATVEGSTLEGSALEFDSERGCSPTVHQVTIKNSCNQNLWIDVIGGNRRFVQINPGESLPWTKAQAPKQGQAGEAPFEASGLRVQSNLKDPIAVGAGGDDVTKTFIEVNPKFSPTTWTFPYAPRFNFIKQSGYNGVNMRFSMDKGADASSEPICHGPIRQDRPVAFARAQTQHKLEDCTGIAAGSHSAARPGTSTYGTDFCEPFCPVSSGFTAFQQSVAPISSQSTTPKVDPQSIQPQSLCHVCSTVDGAALPSQLNAYAKYIDDSSFAYVAQPASTTPGWTRQPYVIGKGHRQYDPRNRDQNNNWGPTFECWDWEAASQGFGPAGGGDCLAEACNNGFYINVEFCPEDVVGVDPVPPSLLQNGCLCLDKPGPFDQARTCAAGEQCP